MLPKELVFENPNDIQNIKIYLKVNYFILQDIIYDTRTGKKSLVFFSFSDILEL